MKRAFAILIFWTLIVQTSCITQKKCNERYPAKDSTYTTETIINDWDTVYLAGGEALIEVDSPCPEYVEFHQTIRKGRTSASIDISKGKLRVECNEAPLREIIKNQKHIIRTFESRKPQVVREVVMKTAWYYTFCVWWFILSMIFTLMFIGVGMLRKKVPF